MYLKRIIGIYWWYIHKSVFIDVDCGGMMIETEIELLSCTDQVSWWNNAARQQMSNDCNIAAKQFIASDYGMGKLKIK